MTPEETASALPEPSLLAFPDWLEQNQATIKEPLQKYRGYSDYVKQETLAQGRYSDTLVAKLDTKLAGLAVESGDYALPEGATEYNPADVLARPVSEEIPAKSILNFAYSTDVADDDPLRPTAAKYEAVRRLADEGRATPEELAAAEADLRQIATPEIMSRATRKDVTEGRSLAAIVPPADPNGAPTVEINDSLLGFVNEDGTVDEPALGKALKMHNTDASLIPAIRAKLARPEGYAKTAMEIEKHGEAMSILDTVARTADPENRFAVFDELGKIANSRERGNSYATEFGVFNLRRAMGEQAKGKSDAELLTLADDFNNMNAMPELDEADPAKSLRRLSTGQVVAPLNLMLNDVAFEKAINDPSVPLTQRDHLRLQRDYAVEASASDIIRTIADNPQGGDEFVAYMDAQRSQGVKDSEIVKGWIGMGKFSATKSTLAGLRSSLGEAVMPFVALATGLDPDGFAIGAMKGAQIEDSNRRAYADLFGKKHGMVYDLGRLVAPVAVDLGAAFLTRGVATGAVAVGKATAGAAVRNVMKTALNAPTRSIMQSWIKAGAASTAKGMGVKLTGRETANEVVTMAGRDIVSKIATGTAYATSMATGFNRSALSTYASLSTALSNQTNPDGTPKYTQEEVREIAMTHGLAAGTITAGVMAGFFGLGAPGMEMVLRKGLTNGQYARIAGRLKKDVAGFGAADANTMIAQFVKQGVTPLFKSPTLLGAAQEGAEEGLDEFMQYFNEARAMGDRISIADAAKQAIYAASLGGVMGGTIAGVGTAIKDRSTPSPRVEADIRRERLLEMAAKLEATAPQTAQVFRNYAFQQRALIPQRQQLESDLKAAKTPEAKAEIKAKIDTLNEQATRSRTEELAPTEENIPQADAAEGDVEAPVDAGMAPEGETVAEGTPEGSAARRTLGGFTGTPVAQRMRATRETVETEFSQIVEESPVSAEGETAPVSETPKPSTPAAPKVITQSTGRGDASDSKRQVTQEGIDRAEAAKQRVRDIVNNKDIVGKQRADAIANGNKLISFLDARADTRKPLKTIYFKGDLAAFDDGDAPDGFQSIIMLEGANAGASRVVSDDYAKSYTTATDESLKVASEPTSGATPQRFKLNNYGGVFDTLYSMTITNPKTPEGVSRDALAKLNASPLNGQFVNGVTLAQDADGTPILVSEGLEESIRLTDAPLSTPPTDGTLPGFPMPPRKRSLSSMRDATVDKLDALDRRLARESDTENYGVLEAGKQRLTALLGKIENVMMAEAQEAGAKVYAEDGTVRPSADPEDIVTIAEAQDVPVVEVVKNPKAAEFSPDESVTMRSPFTGEDVAVSFRGYHEGGSIVWTGKTQMQVPTGWLRKTGSPFVETPESMFKPRRVEDQIKMEGGAEAPVVEDAATKPIPTKKADLIEEYIGPEPSAAASFETRSRHAKLKKDVQKFTVSELTARVKAQRESDAKSKVIAERTTANFAVVNSRAEAAGTSWKSELKKLAQENGDSDYKGMPGNTKGEEVFRLANRLSQRGVSLTQITPRPKLSEGATQTIIQSRGVGNFSGPRNADVRAAIMSEAQEARAKVYAEDGTVRPSADPADAVTIAEAEDVPVVEVVKGGMAVRQEALDAGLDRKTADGLGAAADLAAMFREMGDRTPQQLREARVKNYEGDLEKLPNGTTIHGSLFDKFIPEGNQTVDIRRNKKGEVEVFASEASWTPSGEPKAKLTHKVGEVLVTFPSVADFVDAAYGTPITPRPKLSEGATQTIIQSRGVGNFSGPRNADVRAAIMSEIEGKKVPKSKAGYNAFVDAVANHFGITKEGKTINAYETAINQVVRDSVAPAPAPASSTEPVISDILADVPEGYPLDREEAKLLATAAVMPGGLVSALNSNKYVVQAVKRYAASKGIATEGMNATDLAIVVGGEIEADSVLAELRGESVPAPEVPAAPVAEALKKGDRFTDAQGNTWEVWTTRQGNLQAHPVVNGKAVVNRESGVMFAITEESKSRNPNYRTDIISTVETTQVPEKIAAAVKSPLAKDVKAETVAWAEAQLASLPEVEPDRPEKVEFTNSAGTTYRVVKTRKNLEEFLKKSKAMQTGTPQFRKPAAKNFPKVELSEDVRYGGIKQRIVTSNATLSKDDSIITALQDAEYRKKVVKQLGEEEVARLEDIMLAKYGMTRDDLSDTRNLPSSTPSSAVTKELNSFGFDEGLPAFLANVAKRGGKQYSGLAKLLLNAGAGNVDIRTVNLPNTEAAGFYVGANGVVHINTAKNGPRGAVDTVLHELVHAVTEGSLKNPTPEQQKVIARIERVRATVTKRAKANGTFDNDLQYALGDNAEFLTHFFTSQRFRDQVSAMTPKSEKNWLQVIADLIADLFTGRTKAQKVEAELRKELTTLITAPRIGLAPSDVILNLPAYHATPHVVDQFSLNKIGTGEGAQAFGYGLYFAESEKVSGRGGVYDKKFESKTGKPSNIYRVELDVDTDTLLDWDKPLSGQQADLTAIVQWLKSDENFGGSALPAIERGEITGQKLYNVLTGEIGIRSSSAANPAKASEMMLSAGIKGIRYLDGESRNRPYREIKRGFLDALPDDASFDEVMEIIDDGTFNPQQVAFLKALDADDWFGFDYPAQAISAALSDKIGNWEPSPELRTTIDALRTESTYNYVIFDESAIKILDADIRSQPTSDARNVARFHQLTESLYQGRSEATAAEIEAWKAANPEKWSELAEMREEVLRAGGWDVKATHKTDAEFTEFSEKFTGGTGYYFDVSGDYEFRRNINMDVFLKLGAGLNKGEAFQKYPGSGGNPRRQTILQMKNAGYDHWFTESGEIAVFNSEQIKSADPISPGPRITPDRWADATSPDIRFQPAARPALLPTEQQFNETINQYVTGEWNPAQREARTDQFVREYAQRFAPTADRLGWVFEFTESGDVVAGLSERGKPQIEFGMARMRGQVSGSEVNTFRAVAKMVEEEFIHAAHLYYLTSDADQGQRSAEVFRNSAKVFNQIIDSIRSDGGDAVTEAALASLQTYTPTMTLADLVKMANTSDYVAQDNFVNEFVRQMVQMQNGRPTEEYLAGNKNFLATFMDWLKEKLASLRWAAQNLNLVSPALKENVEGVQAILGDAASPDIRFQLAARNTDAEYLAAVEAGDMETAQRMVDNAAESAGYRQIVAHQTHKTGIEIFDRKRGGKGVYEWDNIGIWTTGRSTPRVYGPVKMELYGRMDNPKRYRDLDAYDKMVREYLSVAYPEAMFELRSDEIESDEFIDKFKRAIKKLAKKAKVGESAYSQKYQQWLTKKFPGAEGFRQYLKDQGYDGIQVDGAFWDGEIQTVRIFLEPEQLKSSDPITRDSEGNVIPLSQRFQSTSPDIRFQPAASPVDKLVEKGHTMLREDFDAEVAKLKPMTRDVFYVGDIEVVRNPTSADYQTMTKEVRSEFGRDLGGDPDIRFTQDQSGNRWIWKAYQGMHSQVEPGISRREGVEVNQNAAPPSHSEVVRQAIRDTKFIPEEVKAQYPQYAEFFNYTPTDIRFQGLTEQDFTPASLRDTATGFLPDDVTLNDLSIDFTDLADTVDGLDPVNAENAVHAAVNHALARRAGEAAIPAPARSEFDSDEAFDAATSEHAAEVARLTDTYELITRGRLTSEAMFRYRTNPGALARLVDYLTAAIKAAYARFTARYDTATAVALNRMSRDLAKARTGFNHDIEPSRGYDPEAVMMLPAVPDFYSQLERTVEAKIPNRATPEQIMATVNAAGVKAEEIKWSGIEQALGSLAVDGKVPKDALLAYLADEGAVRFEEVTLGGKPPRMVKDIPVSEWAKEAMPEQYAQWENATDPEDKAFLTNLIRREHQWRAEAEAPAKMAGDPKFGQYVLPGGENYREVVLAMPRPTGGVVASSKRFDAAKAKELVDQGVRVAGLESGVGVQRVTEKEIPDFSSFALLDDVIEANEQAESAPKSEYTSSHFPDVPNYVAHMRVNERDGGLFIEEIQSDRHQAGRKKGYVEGPRDTTGWEALEDEFTPSRWNVYDAEGLGVATPSKAQAPTAEAAIAWAATAEDQVKGKIADAPFRTTWPLAMFKRALRDAVASGKEWIGWTVGETQNDRFDLSKQVHRVLWEPREGGRGNLRVLGKESDTLLDEEMAADKVEDYIGKEAAARLFARPVEKSKFFPDTQTLDGDGLKVGGSGMKGFYDNMLPKEIGKYVKQWGGKVEQSNIGDSAVVTRRGNDWVVRLPDGETTRFGSETNAREYAGKFSLGATPIWRIDITPAMRESVSTQGQVRFQPAAQPASPARQEQQLLNAQAKNDGWVDLYKDDASVLATADKPEVKNKFLRRVVEALVNPFGALSASATKSVQNRAAMMQTVDYTVSTLGKRLQKAIRDEEADTTAVKLAVGNPDPLLSPSDETRIADDFTAEVDRVTDEIEATYEEELISDPANAEFNRAVAMAEMRREAERNRKIAIWQARNAEANRRREQQLQALAQLERTAPDTYEAIIDLRGMVNKLQRLAREVNADSPVIQAIIDQSQGVYLVRSFAVHQDPKQIDLMMNSQDPLYAERRGALTGFFRDKAYEQIMGELERDPDFLRAYGASYDYDTVLQDMDKRANEGAKTRAQDMFEDFMLGHEQSGGSFGQGSTVSNEIQRYMAKSNMPQEFLDALMVNEDPVFNLANTAMSLGRLVYNARMLQEIHDSGVESGRYITEAEMESGVTYADGKAEMRRVFGIDGSNDNIKLHVLNKITNLLHGELKKRYDDGTLDADPDKDQVRARVATALRSFADTDNVSLADLLPEIGRMADRHAVDAFISYGNKPQEVIANLQPRRGRFATWEPLVSANAGNAAFKPLGGLYADPEQVNAFAATFRTNAKGAEHFAMKALDVANRSLIGMAGASLAIATQGSPSYYVRNIVGNVFYGLINGVSPFDPQKVDLAARAAKSMLSERGEVSAEFQELIAGRIVFDAAKIGYLKQLIEDMTANPNATMQDIVGESVNADLKMQGLTKGAKAKTKAFMLRLGKFAEMTEVLSTVMIYADYKNILTEAGFGTEKEIIQEASRLTKRHTPGRSETASGVNAFTRTGFGAFLAPFLRFKVDNIRILPNIWMDAMTWSRSENPVLMKAGQRKLAAATATMGLITIALPLIFQRAIAGLGDDEDRAIRASLPEYYRNSSLFYFRNAENNGFNIVNLTYTNPLSFVGDPISRIANAVMTGNVSDIPAIMGRFVAEDFIGENIAASNVIDVARNIDSSTSYPIYFEADTGTDKVLKSALHILRSYNPRIVLQGSRFVDSLKREGEQDFWYSPLGVAFATVAPFRPISVSFDDMERRAFSSVRKENAELWRITSRVFSPAPLAPGDAKEMYEKRTAIMDRQAAKALDLYEGFSKIRNGDTTSVERSAVSAGISKTRARLLFNRGVTERLKFPDDDMRRIRQLDPARYAEVIEAVRSQPRFKPVER